MNTAQKAFLRLRVNLRYDTPEYVKALFKECVNFSKEERPTFQQVTLSYCFTFRLFFFYNLFIRSFIIILKINTRLKENREREKNIKSKMFEKLEINLKAGKDKQFLINFQT